MISEAESNAEEDKNFRETVDIKNQGDQLVHATEKTLEELGEKVEAEERANIESAIAELKDALKEDDKEIIEAKIKTLSEASVGMAQKAFEEAQTKANADNATSDDKGVEDVVDAEYEEVKKEEEVKEEEVKKEEVKEEEK